VRDLEIIEIVKGSVEKVELTYTYTTSSHFEVYLKQDVDSWNLGLELKALGHTIEKTSKSKLFEKHIENPRAYKCMLGQSSVALLQISLETWNNRLRIWDLLVEKEWRQMGAGRFLMDFTKKEAKALGARAIVLETQSCNVPAINFYLKQGFQLIGLDLTHYSNDDVARKEVRLEFGLSVN
jgi:ribosomal protein S18 acetylase RimI-like enzyme